MSSIGATLALTAGGAAVHEHGERNGHRKRGKLSALPWAIFNFSRKIKILIMRRAMRQLVGKMAIKNRNVTEEIYLVESVRCQDC
jgi:hypothetical protein